MMMYPLLCMSELRRQLTYKCGWYGSELVEADLLFPSSRLCHQCGARNEPGWATTWNCTVCGRSHDRDHTAAINLARYSEGHAVQLVPPTGVEPSVRLTAVSCWL